MTQPTISFIGGGNMTTSLVNGLLNSGYPSQQLWVSDPNPPKILRFKSLGVHTSHSNIEVAKQADILVIAVKPKDVQALAQELKSLLETHPVLLISIAAGIPAKLLDRWLGSSLHIVRAIPNTPALLQTGATGLYANTRVTEDERSLAESLLRSVGITVWVNHEHELDTLSALSGSGPAYFFLFMQALEEAGKKLGLESKAAKILTLQTALGAARMALESDISLEELINRVATPGGTTEQALKRFEAGKLSQLCFEAVDAAKARSVEMGEYFDKQ